MRRRSLHELPGCGRLAVLRIFAVGVAVSSAACATIRGGTPLAPPIPVERPSFVAGERWLFVAPSGARFEDTYETRRGDVLVFRRVLYPKGSTRPAPPYERQVSAELAFVSGGGLENRPDDGAFRFPLEVGKSWSQRYVRVLTRQGQEREVLVEVKVKVYERLTVPAGTFDAFRIEAVTRSAGDPWSPAHITYWYAPAAKSIVKYHAEASAWGPGMSAQTSADYEMAEYEIKP